VNKVASIDSKYMVLTPNFGFDTVKSETKKNCLEEAAALIDGFDLQTLPCADVKNTPEFNFIKSSSRKRIKKVDLGKSGDK
jgi:hypothetical protein